MAVRRYELTDAQWEQIKDIIPRPKTGKPPKDDRMMLNAMFWLARSGAAWADIPARFGRTKPCTAASASGVTTELFCAFSKNQTQMQDLRTYASTAPQSKRFLKAQV